jgi:hypothetical protein
MARNGVPQISSIENAVRIYYSYPEIGNREIRELFGKKGETTFVKLKNLVKDEMRRRDMLSYGAYKVNTEVAYEVWGLDIKDLEKRMCKLKKYGMI